MVFNLWRGDVAPMRWVCEVTEDATTPQGYRITATDPRWCDPGILDRVRTALDAPQIRQESVAMDDGGIAEKVSTVMPREPGHVALAVRQVDGLYLRAGRT